MKVTKTRLVLAVCAVVGLLAVPTPAQAYPADTVVNKVNSYCCGQTWSMLGLQNRAWCADFVKKVWKESGIDGSDRITAAARSLRDGYGHMQNKPHRGDAVLFQWTADEGTDRVSHVAIVTAVNSDGSIVTVGGNQGGKGDADGTTQRVGPFPGRPGVKLGQWWRGGGVVLGYVMPAKILTAGAALEPGRQWSSPNNRAILRLQPDGNLVVKDENGVTRWRAMATGIPNAFAVFQRDGNLVIYNAENKPRWASNTNGHPGATLWIQGDGNVVIYNAGNAPIWSTRTHH